MSVTSGSQAGDQPKRRILCIDGGGIHGTFPAALLAELEQHLDNPIGSYFDLIAGTSTGGIIAIALSLGYQASEILDLYETRGPEIFGQLRHNPRRFVLRLSRRLRWLYRHKYGPEALRDALHTTLGEKRIGDAQTRLVVPAWKSRGSIRLHLQDRSSSPLPDGLSLTCRRRCSGNVRRSYLLPTACDPTECRTDRRWDLGE